MLTVNWPDQNVNLLIYGIFIDPVTSSECAASNQLPDVMIFQKSLLREINRVLTEPEESTSLTKPIISHDPDH
jgi:hypothetical protein